MDGGEGVPKVFDSESSAISKGLGEKRNGDGLEEKDEFGCKRIKMRDTISDEATTHKVQFFLNTEIIQQLNHFREEIITKVPVALNAEGSECEWREINALPLDSRSSTTKKVPETGSSMANTSLIPTDDDRCTENDMKQNGLPSHPRGKRSVDYVLHHLRQEARSSGGAMEESHSLQGWTEMIQNGLLSCPLSGKASPSWSANNVLLQLRQMSLSGSSVEESDSLLGWKKKKRNVSLLRPLSGKAGPFELGSSADPSGEHISLDDNNYTSRRQISSDLNGEGLPGAANHVLCRSRPMFEARSSDGAAEGPNSLHDWKETKQYGLLSSTLTEKAGPSELGGSADPLGESDSMRRWKEMKRNGFLSGPLGGVATSSTTGSSSQGELPGQKQQKNKRKGDLSKKKKVLPKREQVDRFSNIAAPCGLLKELNPGIINHVRNRKQVRAVIEGLVRIGAENGDQRENEVGISGMGVDYSYLSHGDVFSADANKTLIHLESVGNSSVILEEKSGPCLAESVGKDREVPFKLSSNEESENASSIMNVESADSSNAASLTVEALQRVRKRVEGVVTTELPFLVSKEFPSNQDNNPVMNASGDWFSDKTRREWHQSRWTLLFDQINEALTGEETELECWLLQVKEMISYCSRGQRHMDLASSFASQPLRVSETDKSSLQNA